jgi:uncharacterized membrane protein YgdD (TMEM256/DUF423 family)
MSTETPLANRWLALGALNGLLSVALGALAAHGLEGRLSSHMLKVFLKGVDYQGFHGLALLITGVLLLSYPAARLLHWSAILFLSGILLFSGSLYLLALTGMHFWGFVTPFGGMAFLVGWVMLGMGAWRLGPGSPAP